MINTIERVDVPKESESVDSTPIGLSTMRTDGTNSTTPSFVPTPYMVFFGAFGSSSIK